MYRVDQHIAKEKGPLARPFFTAWRAGSARRDPAAVVGDDDLHAAVQLAAGGRVVVRGRVRLAIAARGDALLVHAHVEEREAHGLRALVRELLVAGAGARAVGEAFDHDGALRILLE